MNTPDEGRKVDLNTIVAAAKNGDLSLMLCVDTVTMQPVYVLCAMRLNGATATMTPLAKLFNGDPYDEVIPA